MDVRKILLVIGIIVGSTIIALGLFIFIENPNLNCKLVKAKPNTQLNNLKNISSSDYKTLVNFAGYLDYAYGEGKETYLPLEFEKVNNYATNETLGSFGLEMNCAKMIFSWKWSNSFIQVFEIKVDLVTPLGDVKSCTIYPDKLQSIAGSHYTCRGAKPRRYPCVSDTKGASKAIAYLEVADLEFEINGDSDIIKKGEFSTVEYNCDTQASNNALVH